VFDFLPFFFDGRFQAIITIRTPSKIRSGQSKGKALISESYYKVSYNRYQQEQGE